MLVPRRMLGQRGAPVGMVLPAEKRSDRVTVVGQGNDFTNSLNVDEETFRQLKFTDNQTGAALDSRYAVVLPGAFVDDSDVVLRLSIGDWTVVKAGRDGVSLRRDAGAQAAAATEGAIDLPGGLPALFAALRRDWLDAVVGQAEQSPAAAAQAARLPPAVHVNVDVVDLTAEGALFEIVADFAAPTAGGPADRSAVPLWVIAHVMAGLSSAESC